MDQITIHLQAGKGGDGVVSFRREKYEPRGGPDGGDGGKGGDILLVVEESFNTLSHLQHQKLYRAAPGLRGGSKRSAGRRGEDLSLKVPPGTLVYRGEKGVPLADLKNPGDRWIAAKGGRGGKGNAHFKSSTHQTPRFAQPGEAGEKVILSLELRLLADVGLVGLPNAGKSTLLSHISKAKPKIASYPFTTISPHLGVVEIDEFSSFVVADIPGLIEGAHRGAGLGDEFLRHIERTRLLFHLLDGSGLERPDPVGDFLLINHELSSYHPSMAKREQLVLVNKMDLPTTQQNLPKLEEVLTKEGYKVFPISAVTGEGILPLLHYAYQRLTKLKGGDPLWRKEEVKVGVTKEELDFSIHLQGGIFLIEGKGLREMVKDLDPQDEEGLLKFSHFLRELGIEEALRKKGAKDGDTVKLGPMDFTFVE